MIRCGNCGEQNNDANIYCHNCGELLGEVQTEERTTSLIDLETGPVDPKRRWGTARFDVDTYLVLHVRDYNSKPIALDIQQDMVIGRTHKDYTPEVDLAPFDAFDRGVSRQHALLRRQNDTVVLMDLHSANSTFLNGQRLVPEDPRILRDGDEVRFGQLVVRVSFEDEPIN